MITECPHLTSFNISLPPSNALIYNDECTLCFDTEKDEGGIDVCLTCYNGGCTSSERQHGMIHHVKTNHPLSVNIHKVLKQVIVDSNKNGDDERAAKITKLEIIETDPKDDENKKYDTIARIRCYTCGLLDESYKLPEIAISGLSASKKSEVSSWTDKVLECEHMYLIDNKNTGNPISQVSEKHCKLCDKDENLWMCLECGSIGCGRKQYDGSGGNNHAIEHFNETGHKASVKLGTIEPNGTADVYCYICDENRMDPFLAKHLSDIGIQVETQKKTEKGMSELELEQNLKLDFSMVTEDGKMLEPVSGSGLTGLRNLGNSCYLSAAVQCVYDLPSFKSRYEKGTTDHYLECTHDLPPKCLTCQLYKLGDGLWSGRYQNAPENSTGNKESWNLGNSSKTQYGIQPRMFKDIISKNNEEFSQMRQQDSFEFLQFMSKQISLSEKKNGKRGNDDPTKVFDFEAEQRLLCTNCQCVRYSKQLTSSITLPIPKIPEQENSKLVSIKDCFDELCRDEIIEDYNCPNCKTKTIAKKTLRFASFPKVLVVQTNRFELVDWVPTKINTLLDVPSNDKINLEKYRGTGIQENERPMPEDEGRTESTDYIYEQVDSEKLQSLTETGFPEDWCKYALLETGNDSTEMAMNYLMENIDRLSGPAPQPTQRNTRINTEMDVDPSLITMLCDMGFTPAQSKRALKETDNDMERAVDWLFSHPEITGEEIEDSNNNEGSCLGSDETENVGVSDKTAEYKLASFISHKGNSIHSGHYVSHVKKKIEGEGIENENEYWVLFNDDHVVKQPHPATDSGYVYILKLC
ncbi:hypothetical protein BB559_004825 [Furculomyces boomerangus]|uniref:Ubiquitin carboxyl-terminal hydrolase n=1 Tax=Furculomyces boomerangus TaxID=61424 RepID=A0A2T9YCD8_9FUNG|nr:hypothetical protein BB559_004825 [Furculomyces boomerangus]